MEFSVNSNFNVMHSSNVVSFSARRLYKLNLKRVLQNGQDEFVPAYFTEITTRRDLERLKKLNPLWEKTSYWKKILLNFEETLAMSTKKYRDKFFIIECPQLKNCNERIRAIVETVPMDHEFGVVFLQSSSVIKNFEKIKGAGTAIMRGICQVADTVKSERIGLLASKNAVKWYEKIGFLRERDDFMPAFILKRADYKNFAAKHSQEYGEIVPLIK